MSKFFSFCIVFCISAMHVHGQESAKKEKKGIAYFAFGSHRILYSPSDIRFSRRGDPAFDFTLSNVKAKDEGGLKFKTAPQFSYTVGYYFKQKGFGLEYQYDHIKYFMTPGQVLRMRGTVDGKSYNVDTLVDFVSLEHSDGGNYAMVNVVKWVPLASDRKKNHVLDLIVKGGVGLVNPKTNSTIMGKRRDDRYHISGYVVGAESGLRYNFFRHFFVTTSLKAAFANYRQFLISNGYGRQKWVSGQVNVLIGGQFPL
ncbi:MAG TPA: hypothetical protein VFR58_06625 [Flavisolibacter sp.]|nr:hypothetical protein [Flavisolibacter sp.]